MIEAMACGTPVIAFRYGSVSEVIDEGITGFIADSEAGAVEAIHHIEKLSRRGVRAQFDRRFTAKRMAQDYVDHYGTLIDVRPRGHAMARRPRHTQAADLRGVALSALDRECTAVVIPPLVQAPTPVTPTAPSGKPTIKTLPPLQE
jgi:hypothetical protein